MSSNLPFLKWKLAKVPFTNLSQENPENPREEEINFDDFASLLAGQRELFLLVLRLSFSTSSTIVCFVNMIHHWGLDMYRGGYEIIWWHSFVILSIDETVCWHFPLSVLWWNVSICLMYQELLPLHHRRSRFANKSIRLIKKLFFRQQRKVMKICNFWRGGGLLKSERKCVH